MSVLNVIITILGAFISIMVMVLCVLLRKEDEDSILNARSELIETQRKQQKLEKFSKRLFKKNRKKYNEMKVYLSRVGANYMLNRVIDPLEFILVKFILAIFAGVVGYACKDAIGAVFGVVLGYKALDLLLEVSNKRDNEFILQDIRSIYETVIIKTEGGMFLTDAILQCYKITENERLKDALLQLSGEISTKNNIKEAIDKFALKFKNRYITSFCVIIKQGFESGETLNALTDVSKQLTNIQSALEYKEKEKLDYQIMICEFLILADMIFVILYVVIYNFSTMANVI